MNKQRTIQSFNDFPARVIGYLTDVWVIIVAGEQHPQLRQILNVYIYRHKSADVQFVSPICVQRKGTISNLYHCEKV